MTTQLDQAAYLEWEHELGFDKHGGAAKAAGELGVSVETIRLLRNGSGNYSRTLGLAMTAVALKVAPWPLPRDRRRQVAVYGFSMFNVLDGEMTRSKRMAPRSFIVEHGGTIDETSMRFVNIDDLDSNGIYTPPKKLKGS